jgi:hypothetical protein
VHYGVSTLIYSFAFDVISCDAPQAWSDGQWEFYTENMQITDTHPRESYENFNSEDGLTNPVPDPTLLEECLNCDDWKPSTETCECYDEQGDGRI